MQKGKQLKSYRELSLLWSLRSRTKKILTTGLIATVLGVIAVENVPEKITALSFITNLLLMCIFLIVPFILIMIFRNLIAKLTGYFYIFILGSGAFFAGSWWDVMYCPKEKQYTFFGKDPRKDYLFKKSKKHHLFLQWLVAWLLSVTIILSWAIIAGEIIPNFFK